MTEKHHEKPPVAAVKEVTPPVTVNTALPPEAYMTEQEKAGLQQVPASKKETE